METTKYLIIGAGLSGQNAAKAIRELDAAGRIVMLGNEPNRPYDRPPLTKGYMQNKVPAEKTYYQPPEWYDRNRIELHVGQHVEHLDAQSRIARTADGWQWQFEKALLAMGGRPVKLDSPGIGLRGRALFPHAGRRDRGLGQARRGGWWRSSAAGSSAWRWPRR